MCNNYVTLTFPYIWQFKEYPHIKITRCKMVIDSKKGKILKYTQRGFYIGGKYYKRKEINNFIEKPKEDYCPF